LHKNIFLVKTTASIVAILPRTGFALSGLAADPVTAARLIGGTPAGSLPRKQTIFS